MSTLIGLAHEPVFRQSLARLAKQEDVYDTRLWVTRLPYRLLVMHEVLDSCSVFLRLFCLPSQVALGVNALWKLTFSLTQESWDFCFKWLFERRVYVWVKG